ncbi:MAG: type VI secretion system tip protein VgrG, partial [Deltaproteobacteria bacterium]|nr:type VI secretion system tip protein VgrG [Deltaproteobacteria bacterium]
MTSDVLTLRIDPFVVGLEGGASIVSIEGHEQVSRPFRYWVTLRSEMLDVAAVRGTVATFRIEDRHGNVRLVSGIVAGVEAVATQSLGQSVWRLKLVPRPFTTSWRHGFRIFQEMSVPEIVKKVFADAGIEDEYFRWPDGIDGRYPKREYCVQYDESEWSFVSRLLEEEGIWYTFEHAAEPVDVGAHVMVLGETSEEAAEQSLSFLEHVWRAPDGAEGSVAAWRVESESRASIKAVALDDYDMRVPSKPLEVQAPATSAQAKPIDEADTVPRREWYEYPGRYVDEAVGKRLARSRLEELRGRRRQLRATTNALYLQTGRRFELQQHPFADGWYFLTRLGMTIRMEGDSTEGATGQAWECSIEAVPQDQPFRPHRA